MKKTDLEAYNSALLRLDALKEQYMSVVMQDNVDMDAVIMGALNTSSVANVTGCSIESVSVFTQVKGLEWLLENM